MRYNYNEGIVRQTSRRWVVLVVVGLVAIVYALTNYFAPTIFYVFEPADTTAKKLVSTQPESSQNRVYVPKINIDVPIASASGDDASTPLGTAVNRLEANGNPIEGGNYVVVADRMKLGLTPWQTEQYSPYYHLSKLSKEDDIYVDYKGVRFAYKVQNVETIGEVSAGVNERTESKRMTLYASEDSSAGRRTVVVAEQVGKIVWTNGQPRLQSAD